MRAAIEKLEAERKNQWHEMGLELQKAFEGPRITVVPDLRGKRLVDGDAVS